ncbi:MAG: carbohydrate ABC transporter substrate-binding protein [Spirochaetes bacterium]|uniref:Carbohydrate ABC transporter substrate-binding protein n=1 Tax=Candidatus Aphodenecus pullistercoris TaxID=2840669 RepID=A0A9D9E8E2_9SPIR|nr:carbohydrate ABC transporter substrate-binding protein [Candidatus Aphodenecus pullistercoris]
MKKLLISVLVALTVVATVFAGGASESQSASSQDSNTLTVWAWDPNFNIAALRAAEALYQQDHPDFSLNIVEYVYNDIQTMLITAAEAGNLSTLPDIFLMQDYQFHTYANRYPEVFTSLNDSGIDFSQFTAGKTADSNVNGNQYGVPFDNSTTIFAIRKDIVEEAGFTVEDFMDITWDQFIEQARVVKEKTKHPMITISGGSEIIIEILQSAGSGSPVVNGELNIADNEVLYKAFEIYKTMYDEGILVDYTDWNEYIASMNNGVTGGVIQGCWILASIEAAADQSGLWRIVNIPRLGDVEGATNYANIGGSSWVVSGNANTELAIDFLRSTFASSTELYDQVLAENSVIASYLPAADSELYGSQVEFYGGQSVYADIVEFAGNVPAIDYGNWYNEIRDALNVALTNIVQNGADIRSEMQAAEDTARFNIGL